MKNTVAVTIGLRYRFRDFECGQVLKSGDGVYMEIEGKHPLVDLATGKLVHYALIEDMHFELPAFGSTVNIGSTFKPHIRIHNVYKRVPRPKEVAQ